MIHKPRRWMVIKSFPIYCKDAGEVGAIWTELHNETEAIWRGSNNSSLNISVEQIQDNLDLFFKEIKSYGVVIEVEDGGLAGPRDVWLTASECGTTGRDKILSVCRITDDGVVHVELGSTFSFDGKKQITLKSVEVEQKILSVRREESEE